MLPVLAFALSHARYFASHHRHQESSRRTILGAGISLVHCGNIGTHRLPPLQTVVDGHLTCALQPLPFTR